MAAAVCTSRTQTVTCWKCSPGPTAAAASVLNSADADLLRWAGETAMIRRMPRVPGLPLGGGLNVLLVAGAAYFAWEHEQGRHGRPHALCAICWLNKVAPGP